MLTLQQTGETWIPLGLGSSSNFGLRQAAPGIFWKWRFSEYISHSGGGALAT